MQFDTKGWAVRFLRETSQSPTVQRDKKRANDEDDVDDAEERTRSIDARLPFRRLASSR